MSEADKMLEKIGYTVSEQIKNGIVYLKETDDEDMEISFIDYEDYGKTVEVDKFDGLITMQELRAINMKCKELRLDMTVRDFLKDILNKKTRKKKIQIRYGSGYYTFFVEDFKFIKNTNGTGLVIGKILDDEIEVS